ncbi:alkaline phosphatase family protein [Rubrobacter marinus]|uniref:Alkaline phosphatase family protein n=1 Tax=Rubrobacter marinus TaxID=2653852 RepID=A0A6G8Q1U2_9ACTN|nr:alkaline phosphatase D family protein [Rubrobacter marinus]QIN80441.1 alkaline phosphatase family protein [Rubrobacter marinus]
MSPGLVLGPLLRYAGTSEATVWVETEGACEVEVRVGDGASHRARTFHVEGHYYALVHVTGLSPGEVYPYEVLLDGEHRWPEPGSAFPPSTIRAHDPETPFGIVFGSCRISLPNEAPYTLTKKRDKRGRGADALHALAQEMLDKPQERWPDALLMLGDQIYADEVSPGTRGFIRSRRGTSGEPGYTVADFQEYTHLYWDAWSEPVLRWLLSTVPVATIFDDHDVHDDWNTSLAWLEKMRRKPWWHERITGGFMSYWIYQHIGNLSPDELRGDELFARVRTSEDAGPILREFARKTDREPEGSRWSYHRDFGNTRLLVVDTRAGRMLEEGRRSILDPEEWAWLEEKATGSFDHLLIGTSLPVLLPPGLHHAESWNEAVCAGAWGRAAAPVGEVLRQAIDLEHWSAFRSSFDALVGLLREVGSGERGRPPASIVLLSGDVHHGYLAEAELEDAPNLASAVYQAVCSPLRNTLGTPERLAMLFGWSRAGEAIFEALARAAGVGRSGIRWRLTHGRPCFDNHVGAIEMRGREARLEIRKTVPAGTEDPREVHLSRVLDRRLA